ncbi:MAG TPA: Rieske (2Fe-2S) protein [Acidimicrobiia bacterium]|jgi:nitrite reductase/ring-hydroxylating ferredoxin subunit/uncharacterized membrane protein
MSSLTNPPDATAPADALTEVLDGLAHTVENLDAVDDVAAQLQDRVHGVLGRGTLRDALTGRWLGHAVHPVLTDLPIGFWTSAFTLDLIGGRRSRAAAQLLVGLGVLAAIPTAATGAADWSDTAGKETRVGLVHAALNTTALACFSASWIARRRGRHGRGVLYGIAGSAAATGGGFFGGHLIQRFGVGVDHTTFDALPGDWTATDPASAWSDGSPRRVDADGAPVVVIRDGDTWYGLEARCTHAGGPLDEGEVLEGCVQCPWHGSRFRLRDGSVARGPAFAAEPVADVRVHDGVVEVRAATTR